MFRGSIPADMRDMLITIMTATKERRFFVGCSGNFTVERTLINVDQNAELHSNDVNLYSVMIGRHFSGKKLGITLNPNRERYGFMQPYMKDSAGQLACVMIASNFTLGVGKESNPYYNRMLSSYEKQFETIHAKTVENIKKTKFKLADFFAGDVVDWLGNIPKESSVIMYPPFFAKDYTMQFKGLTEIFQWEEPEFVEMDEDRKEELISRITDKDKWVMGLHVRRENMEPWLVGITQTKNRSVPIYLYSNLKTRKMITMPHQQMTNLAIPRLGKNEKIGKELKVVKLDYDVFCSMRSMYMNASIKPGAPTLSFGVLVDDKMVGCFSMSTGGTEGRKSLGVPRPSSYLLSDFPVVPTLYPRLSKLILYAALSHEIKLIFEHSTNKRVRGLLTTAFSDRPVSMKYRGLFKLIKREKMEKAKSKSTYIGKKFMLNYGQEMGNWSLEKGFAEWQRKHGKVLRPE